MEILGTGCPKCNKTKKFVEEAVAQAGVDAEIVKVEDMNGILAYGVLITPAVVVDGEVKIVGRVPKVDEVIEWITR
ncbi:thioredoxin family protein [Methanolobus psychrotolerans]|uniref:thioredoxin family protein n=1 Tax=Methanolobus psychrotolerans TaxID=1874706 RepID=UPI00374406A0